jgi:hypothetical protein
MQRLLRSVLLAAALGPLAGCAASIYDEPHGDYHRWDRNEEVAFRAYLGERGRTYVEFRRLNPGEQREYWGWRHNHLDRDRDRDHDRDHR